MDPKKMSELCSYVWVMMGPMTFCSRFYPKKMVLKTKNYCNVLSMNQWIRILVGWLTWAFNQLTAARLALGARVLLLDRARARGRQIAQHISSHHLQSLWSRIVVFWLYTAAILLKKGQMSKPPKSDMKPEKIHLWQRLKEILRFFAKLAFSGVCLPMKCQFFVGVLKVAVFSNIYQAFRVSLLAHAGLWLPWKLQKTRTWIPEWKRQHLFSFEVF